MSENYIKSITCSEFLKKKYKFVKEYIKEDVNPADASKFDSNANVTSKNVATLHSEIFKEEYVNLNRYIMYDDLKQMYGEEVAKKYLEQLHNNLIYKHDESSPFYPYCVSVTMYPFLLNGLSDMGAESKAPKHLESFVGNFINLTYLLSGQFAGACSTPEVFFYITYFIKKDYGRDFYLYDNVKRKLRKCFEQIIYSINSPATARSYQSIFWNVSLFDKAYFKEMFGNFVFPDGSKIEYEELHEVQKIFMEYFQKERERALLTFPVITMAMVSKDGENIDKEFEEWVCERALEGDDFFIYQGEANALSSCCRLRNEIEDNVFSHSLGAGGVATGSLSVLTLNLPHFVQDCIRNNEDIFEKLKDQLDIMYKFQTAFKKRIEDFLETNMLPIYNAGYINIKKQFLTIGLNGVPEAYEVATGKKFGNTEEYRNWVKDMFSIITASNKEARQKYGHRFNTELIPGENVAVKFAQRDIEKGYKEYEIYSSYFYKPEDESCNMSDKFILHGELGQFMDGGVALHLNLKEPYTTKEQFLQHLRLASKIGLNYWTWNVPRSMCEKCGKIVKRTVKSCPHCNGRKMKHATRVIGFLKFVESFSEGRRKEAGKRIYH